MHCHNQKTVKITLAALKKYETNKKLKPQHMHKTLTLFNSLQNVHRVSVLSVMQSKLASVTHSFKTGCSTDKLMVFIPLTLSCSASRSNTHLQVHEYHLSASDW